MLWYRRRAKVKSKKDPDEKAMDIDDKLESKGTGYRIATKGSFVTVLETHKNIVPIVDAVLVNIDNIGRAFSYWRWTLSLERQV